MLDLLVLGCGPVGAVAGNLAGRAGLNTLVVDRARDIFTVPRAIHFDAHIMRILQQVGLARSILPDVRVWRRSTFYGMDGKPIRVHEWPTDQPYGWDAHYLFYQPTLEAILRAGLQRFETVDVGLGREVIGLEQHGDHVTALLRDHETGTTGEVSARFLIGADGASSFARIHSGIGLVDGAFDEPWLVVDVLCDRELGRPGESEMFCNPARPATRVPGPGAHHRWEFMLLPDESAEQIQRPESIEALLAPWVRMDEVTLIRSSVYRFHALVAERWRAGRIFLAGDAAHQTPVFLGQGLCHGVRDVQNLVGKLAAVLGGAPAEVLLESYEAERRPHVEQIIKMSVAGGREICVLDIDEARERDARMRSTAIEELPPTTFQGMPPLRGGLFGSTPGAGEQFFQPHVSAADGQVGRFDDLIPAQVVIVAPGDRVSAVAASARSRAAVVAWTGAGSSAVDLPDCAWVICDDAVQEWFRRHGTCFAVLRPDRYVHGTAGSAEEAEALLLEVSRMFPAAT